MEKTYENDLRLEAVKVHQNGHNLFTTQLSPEVLRDYVEIDRWEHDLNALNLDPDDQGYQRIEQRTHYTKIGQYLANDKDAMMPTSALMSVRGEVYFEPVTEGAKMGYLVIPKESLPMYAVDAQHRRKGLLYAIDEMVQKHLEDFSLPAVVMTHVTKLTEVKQFYTVNSTAKRIDTDLAERLLTEMAERDSSFKDELIGKKKAWLLRGVKAIIRLNDTAGGPWSGRIQRPNQPKSGAIVIAESSLVNSLKPVLSMPWIADPNFSTEDFVKLINRYWEAILNLMPEANDDPSGYALQKTTGCYVMHLVAPIVFEICRSEKNFSTARIEQILEPAAEVYLNAEFWVKGGEAGTFSSSTGFQKLADRIQNRLSETAATITI